MSRNSNTKEVSEALRDVLVRVLAEPIVCREQGNLMMIDYREEHVDNRLVTCFKEIHG